MVLHDVVDQFDPGPHAAILVVIGHDPYRSVAELHIGTYREGRYLSSEKEDQIRIKEGAAARQVFLDPLHLR